MKKIKFIGIVWMTTLVISACIGTNSASPLSSQTAASTQTFIPTHILTPTQTPTTIPTATQTPIPHPLEINGRRARDYPGSDIVLEDMLDPGLNNSRYMFRISQKD